MSAPPFIIRFPAHFRMGSVVSTEESRMEKLQQLWSDTTLKELPFASSAQIKKTTEAIDSIGKQVSMRGTFKYVHQPNKRVTWRGREYTDVFHVYWQNKVFVAVLEILPTKVEIHEGDPSSPYGLIHKGMVKHVLYVINENESGETPKQRSPSNGLAPGLHDYHERFAAPKKGDLTESDIHAAKQELESFVQSIMSHRTINHQRIKDGALLTLSHSDIIQAEPWMRQANGNVTVTRDLDRFRESTIQNVNPFLNEKPIATPVEEVKGGLTVEEIFKRVIGEARESVAHIDKEIDKERHIAQTIMNPRERDLQQEKINRLVERSGEIVSAIKQHESGL